VARHSEPEETRVDRWLCAVRLVKTRRIATQLCEGGHVLVNGVRAKPSTKVRQGDELHARIAARDRIVEVVRPIDTRLGAAAVVDCYVDRSPPPPARELVPSVKVHRGDDWANKRFRRELDRMRRRPQG
jgi:ribosome-associated heat shock protein Hsp15